MTTTRKFSILPGEIIAAIEEDGMKVNGYPVLDIQHGGNRTYVLCDSITERSGPFHRFVTWSVWVADDGRVAAEAGDYITSLAEAVANLHYRAGLLNDLKAQIAKFA